jgi:hypothetical protein
MEKAQAGQAFMEFILFSVAAFFALKVTFLFAGKIWVENLSQVYLQEFIFCQHWSTNAFQKTQCRSDFELKLKKAIPFAQVLNMTYSKRANSHHASINLQLLSLAKVKFKHSLVIE